MREYLFRGKRITGKWVYGNLLEMGREYIRGQWEDQFAIFLPQVPKENSLGLKVDTKTIGQFIGLLDKSSVKIFEGDVVKDGHGNIGVIVYSEHFLEWRIVFHKGRNDLINKQGCRTFEWVYPEMDLEVIGNIHDNAELLEE